MLRCLRGALIVLLLGAPLRAQEGPADLQPKRSGVQVMFRNEPLFQVRAPSGALSPRERAAAIESRLLEIAQEGSSEQIDRIRVQPRDQAFDVYVGDSFVLEVTDADAAPVGRTAQQLAADDEVSLRKALAREYEERSFRGILRAVLLSALATALLILVLRVSFAVFPQLMRRTESFCLRLVPKVRLGRLQLLTAERMSRAVSLGMRASRLLLVLTLILVYLGLVLSLFPWTRAFSHRVASGLLDGLSGMVLAVVSYLPNLLYIAAIVVITRGVLRLARFLIHEVGRGNIPIRGFHAEWTEPTYKIGRFLILALAAVVVFPYLPGSHSPAFQGISIFLGVLFSLGSSSAIGNVVAGVALTYMRPFSVGDRVKIADTVGDVVEKNLLVVRVRTIKNVEITISNSMVLGNHIVNYSACAANQGLILNTSVTIGYSAPWRKIHELLIAAASSVDGVLRRPEPFVLQTALDDFYVRYELNAYTDRPAEMAAIYSRLHQAIQDRFNEAGLEIMSPHYSALRDGNAIAIPADAVPAGYEAPRFRVEDRAPDARAHPLDTTKTG